ncbi:MAG: apolipoprotein N-acyltransferase, partial [Myxococcales bacterium]
MGLRTAVLAAVASGLLYFLAFAGMDVWPLAFVAFVPLLVAVRGQSPSRAFALGLLTGTTASVAGIYWLLGMLQTFSGFPAPVCAIFVLALCTYQGGWGGVHMWLVSRAEARGWPFSLAVVLGFATAELLYPLLFPFYFAATVHSVPVLAQSAELGGPILVGVLLVIANVALAELVSARIQRRKADRRVLLVSLVVTALSLVFGFWRVVRVDRMVASAPSATVGVVQANMGLLEKRNDSYEGLRRHLTLTRGLSDIDFVVWSETSVMQPIEESSLEVIERGVGQDIGVPAIFGAVLYRFEPPPRDVAMFNTALSTDVKGRVNGRFDKAHLLMFGEYLPFGEWFPALYGWSPQSGRFSPGKSLEPLVIDLGGVKHPVSTLVCYEDILPSFTNTLVHHGSPELLVNMTNDAWFGDTIEPWQHLALAKFRAIEHRRFLVRATNSGVSAVIDPVGRVVAKTATSREGTLRVPIRWLRGTTVYEVLGDAPWIAVSLLSVVGAMVRR